MEEAKHTKGPWQAIGLSIHTNRNRGKGSPETWVAVVKPGRADEVESADARLIAAAPDLLEALERIVALCDACPGVADGAAEIARAAISEAKGGA